MVTALTPARVRVRMYQAWFGESILVTTEYTSPAPGDRGERHILFDFGSTHPPTGGTESMKGTADLIARHTNGQLDVLVVTHRHKDHLSGFGDPGAAQALADLSPKLVLRPWTEDPSLTDAAVTPPPGTPVGTASRRFAAHLAAAQQVLASLAQEPVPVRGARGELRAVAAAQAPNQRAIAALDAMAAGERGRYLHAGSPLELTGIVPGMTVTVLGPPTIEQYPPVTREANRDPEYWMLHLRRALQAAMPHGHPEPHRDSAPPSPPGPGGATPETATTVPPGPVRWLVERLAGQQTHSAVRLVRALDDALNNTSLILLLEIGNLSLLFPGDAQIENWRYTLDQLGQNTDLRAKLAGIDLYKVGHHGSRNATPRSLHKLWVQRAPGTPRMTALISTRHGVYGTTPATAVPRATLLEALGQVADLYSTSDLPDGQLFCEVVAETAGGPFQAVQA